GHGDRRLAHGVHHLLHGADRRRESGRRGPRLAGLGDVGAQRAVPAPGILGPGAHQPRGGDGGGRRLGGSVPIAARGADAARARAHAEARLGPGPPMRILDRYVTREFLRLFLLFALASPLMFVIFDITDNLDRHLARGIPPARVALSYVY